LCYHSRIFFVFGFFFFFFFFPYRNIVPLPPLVSASNFFLLPFSLSSCCFKFSIAFPLVPPSPPIPPTGGASTLGLPPLFPPLPLFNLCFGIFLSAERNPFPFQIRFYFSPHILPITLTFGFTFSHTGTVLPRGLFFFPIYLPFHFPPTRVQINFGRPPPPPILL